MRLRSIVAAVGLCLAGTGLCAAEPAVSDYVNVLKPGPVTPHRVMAPRYAGGRLKTLCIVPYKLGAREVLEVAQRFPFDYEVVTTGSHDELDFTRVHHFGQFAAGLDADLKHKTQELRVKLRGDYDLIAIGNVVWEKLPDGVIDLIIKKVEAGTGLVVTCDQPIPPQADGLLISDPDTAEREFILRETPIEHLDATRRLVGSSLLRAYKLGKGRVVFLRYAKPQAYNGGHAFTPMDGIEHFDRWAENYEHYVSLFVKSALFAAGKSPTVQFDQPRFDAAMTAVSVPVRFLKQPGDIVDWRLVIRDAEGAPEHAASGQLKPADAALIECAVPRLSVGTHFLEVTLESEGQVLNWAAFGLATPTESPIHEIALERPMFAPGAAVAGKIVCTPRPAACRVELIDHWGRIIARQSDADLRKAGDVFTLSPAGNPSLRFRVRVAAGDAQGNTIARQSKPVFVNDTGRGRFTPLVWGSYPPCYLAQQAQRRLYDAGWSARLGADSWIANLRTIPQAAVISGFEHFDTPAEVADLRKQVANSIRTRAGEPIWAYFLGDENIIGRGWDAGLDSPAATGFPRYLEAIYGTVDRLNAAWKTDYKSFADARPARQSEATATGAPGRWVTYRNFVSDEFFKVHLAARDMIHEADPGAPTGIEGTDFFQAGQWFNPFRLYRELGMWGPYPDFFHAMVLKSSRQADKPFGYWFGGYRDTYMGRIPYSRTHADVSYLLWKHAIDGANSLWWFSEGSIEGMFDLNLEFAPYYLRLRDDIDIIASSIGPMLMDARFQHDDVAVLYSHASVTASVAAARSQDPFQTLGADLVHIMQACGVQPLMVDEEDVARGRVDLRTFKAIVLPYNIAMSDTVVAKLLDATHSGATLIGGMDIGFMDQNGDYRSSNPLHDAFGIARDINPACPSRKVPLAWRGDLWGAPVELDIKSLAVGDCLRLTTGKPALGAELPIVITNRFGKGEGILLNCWLGTGDPRRPQPLAGAALWRALLRHAGVNPPFRMSRPADDPSLIELSTFRNGDGWIVGLLKNKHWNADADTPMTLVVPPNLHGRDLLTGKELPPGPNVDVTLHGTRAAFMTFFPRKEPPLTVAASAPQVRPGQTLRLTVSGRSANHFVDRYSLRVFRADQATTRDSNHGVCPQWSLSLVKREETLEMTIPIAHNEVPGNYRAVVRRDMTGETKALSFAVSP